MSQKYSDFVHLNIIYLGFILSRKYISIVMCSRYEIIEATLKAFSKIQQKYSSLFQKWEGRISLIKFN